MKWICCDSINKLLGLVKYVILPSIQLSRAKIKNKNQSEICFGIMGYVDTIEELNYIKSNIKFISEYKDWFTQLEKHNKKLNLK